ncbi:hypothetical protein BpHYR1_015916 [Brachionus plicatilis]|uniref:Uncharacterized protein n=1 Tax=Brachionus plicatilis TaxID=10195 RepID=A0A3M7P417_BRAPC|nr:hypothetical protein BpHYR1_015916 [Brachionus plicatilis]
MNSYSIQSNCLNLALHVFSLLYKSNRIRLLALKLIKVSRNRISSDINIGFILINSSNMHIY